MSVLPIKFEGGIIYDKCSNCGTEGKILMRGYAHDDSGIVLCEYHAFQLVRKIMEDICELHGDRHD